MDFMFLVADYAVVFELGLHPWFVEKEHVYLVAIMDDCLEHVAEEVLVNRAIKLVVSYLDYI